MIICKFLKSKRSFFICECNCCFSLFTRRSDYKSHESCTDCSNAISGRKRTVHGLNNRNSRLHVTWQNMKKRCLDPSNKKYSAYGGAGIKVCDDWMDFLPFMEWSLSNGYNDSMTIDRIDNSKGYNPDNCRYADISTQNANKRKTSANKTGYLGVSIYYEGRYLAKVQWRGDQFVVGYFDDPKEAAKARDLFIKQKGFPHTLNFD